MKTMTRRQKYVFWVGGVIWILIVLIGDTGFVNEMKDDFLRGSKTFNLEDMMPFAAATIAWCVVSYLVAKLFGGKG